MEWISTPEAWIALLSLTALEIVLGIDNIIFISILASKLPEEQQNLGRQIGLVMAMVTRIALLFSLTWLTRLTSPLFSVFSYTISGRDLILISGGLFLLAKSTFEIHERLEGEEGHASQKVAPSLSGVVIQIMILDIVFSLDSVITAIGMVNEIAIMVTAVVIAVGIMLIASGPISAFVNDRPTLKILALSFLLLIGFSLVADGLGFYIPKGYIYFAMGFSVFVEIINLQVRARTEPVQLRQRYIKE
jgi:predicted tellurium resistance membrane protein TerC